MTIQTAIIKQHDFNSILEKVNLFGYWVNLDVME